MSWIDPMYPWSRLFNVTARIREHYINKAKYAVATKNMDLSSETLDKSPTQLNLEAELSLIKSYNKRNVSTEKLPQEEWDYLHSPDVDMYINEKFDTPFVQSFLDEYIKYMERTADTDERRTEVAAFKNHLKKIRKELDQARDIRNRLGQHLITY
jgi:hypothetical protein